MPLPSRGVYVIPGKVPDDRPLCAVFVCVPVRLVLFDVLLFVLLRAAAPACQLSRWVCAAFRIACCAFSCAFYLRFSSSSHLLFAIK